MLKQLLIATISLTAASALAAPKNVTLEHGGAVTRFHGTPTGSVIHQQRQPPLVTIFSNLIPPYNCCTGWTLAGPTSPPAPPAIYLAEQFTTGAAPPTAREIDVAVGWVTGNNGITVGLYTDGGGGVPVAQLAAKKVKNLTTFGSSSTAVARAKLKPPVTLAANTAYWVTITLPNADANEWAAWNWSGVSTPITAAREASPNTWAPIPTLTPAGGFAVYH